MKIGVMLRQRQFCLEGEPHLRKKSMIKKKVTIHSDWFLSPCSMVSCHEDLLNYLYNRFNNLGLSYIINLQWSPKKWSPSLKNYVPAAAYHFYLALPANFSHPGALFLATPVLHGCAAHKHLINQLQLA